MKYQIQTTGFNNTGDKTMSFVSPLDLLTVSSSEQDVIRCLVRKPQLTALEISGLTKIPLKELETLLKQMVSDARVVQLTRNEAVCFEVSFSKGSGKNNGKKGSSVLDMLFP